MGESQFRGASLAEGYGSVPTLFPMVRPGLLLFAIFSLKKKKKRKLLGQQLKKSTPVNGKEKEENCTQPVTW